jgi:hypothetical protein
MGSLFAPKIQAPPAPPPVKEAAPEVVEATEAQEASLDNQKKSKLSQIKSKVTARRRRRPLISQNRPIPALGVVDGNTFGPTNT